jgi:isopentenyl-diphosphate delta-isomerase
MIEQVILVDQGDCKIGVMEKIEAHRLGILHRAFSIFIINNKSEMLLQQRAINKYHSGGLWTNACCSHPKPGESNTQAAKRRLLEEMGIVCDLKPVFQFNYQAMLDNGLMENEFDHVYLGKFSGVPVVNAQEVSDWKYVSIPVIQKKMENNPQIYTSWFKIAFPKLISLM